jgi:hypothetical protein
MDKIRTSVTLLPSTLEWVSKKVEQCVYRSTSHAFDFLVAEARREEEKAGD